MKNLLHKSSLIISTVLFFSWFSLSSYMRYDAEKNVPKMGEFGFREIGSISEMIGYQYLVNILLTLFICSFVTLVVFELLEGCGCSGCLKSKTNSRS